MWGKASYPLLQDLMEPLNDKSEYAWEKIEGILLDYLRKTGKYKTHDYTFGNLTSFIGNVMRAKYELINKDFEQYISSDDVNIKTIRSYVFSKVKIYSEIQKITTSKLRTEEKGIKIVNTIISYHDSFALPRFTLFEPFYYDESRPPYGIELDELYAMERRFDKEKQKIEEKYSNNQEMKKIKIDGLFETNYYKRIASCESRRVMGASLTFSQKEEKIREEARAIASKLVNILISWGITQLDIAQRCISHYWDLFEEKAWERQKQETEYKEFENKWKYDIQEMKRIQVGQWDSNTMTLLGVIIAIFVSIFFGLPSIFNKLAWYYALCIALGFTSLFVMLFKLKTTRKFIIRSIKKILSKVQL